MSGIIKTPNGAITWANVGGGGGGTTDYEDLDNKPSINGVLLVGNKTNSDLGIIIPTTLAELEEDTTHRTVTDEEKAKWNQGGSGGGGTAETTTYDNTTSGLDAENVQDAIDEVNESLTHKENEIKHFDSMEDYEANKSQVADGDLFAIDDYDANKGEIYSTDEIICGTWVDGKTLYKKTFIVNNPAVNWAQQSLPMSDLIDHWFIDGSVVGLRNDGYIITPYYYNSGDFLQILVSSLNGALYYFAISHKAYSWFKFTVKYTKV